MGNGDGEDELAEQSSEAQAAKGVEENSCQRGARWLGIALGLTSLLAFLLSVLLTACSGEGDGRASVTSSSQSCMVCHNGSPHDDYAGPGIEDPHPFGGTEGMSCTVCHGGDGNGGDKEGSHVPAPPQIGGREQWEEDAFAYFNRLTLTGIDRLPDYQVGGKSYTALDYLQFINPGDLRIVQDARGCGQCHTAHADSVTHSLLATEAGIFSGATYSAGIENQVFESRGIYEDTAADLGFRAIDDPSFNFNLGVVGPVSRLLQMPVFSVRGREGETDIYRNDDYNAAGLEDDIDVLTGRALLNSPLANLYHEQVAFTCGDCHLGSAGANNRYGDFRSSGCSACHMPKSLDGRSRSGDPNVPIDEPADPDDIDEPELSHLRRHRILSIKKTLPNGMDQAGIDDYTCAGCHQGSNRTVMQYWGIRLDQNQDLRNEVQYPADPFEYEDTSGDERLFDPEVGNNTFNGRNRRQYIRFEDYDGDGRDDTPADVHYEAGLGCIDCHGSHDLHGGQPGSTDIQSRMEQSVAIRCESCHGSVDEFAPTAQGLRYDGATANLALDGGGNPLRHVERDANGDLWLTSRLTGARHFVRQTRDVVVDSGRAHPETGEPLWSAKASYAMGRADGDPATGIGPLQDADLVFEPSGFSHGDGVSCAACHSSWTNSCIGCHLSGKYDNGNNFSNITGERIVFEEDEADFVYQTPIHFQLGIGPDNKVQPITPNTDTFWRYRDREGEFSKIFAFTDRNNGGNHPSQAAPSLAHNVMMPHSIRGKIDSDNEGPRYCNACHLTEAATAAYGPVYDEFRLDYREGRYDELPFDLLKSHIGQNTNNRLDSPFYVHMAAGLGTGLFLFDEDGCAVNPLDDNPDRVGCEGQAPSGNFDPARVAFDLDRIVTEEGISTGSSSHPMLEPGAGPNMREGAANPNMSGPLGSSIVRRLADPEFGIVLDAWLDADGEARGNAAAHMGETP